MAIDAGEARRERVVAALAGAKLRLGMHPDGSDSTLNLVVSTPPPSGYRPAQSLEFLSFLGIPRERLAPGWSIPEADRRYADRLLELRRKGRAAGCWAWIRESGSAGSAAPQEAGLARGAGGGGARSPAVRPDGRTTGRLRREFKKCLKSRTLEAPSRGLRDVLAFLGSCRLFLAGNTNLFHFAVALGVPTIGVLPREEEERWVRTTTLAAGSSAGARASASGEEEFLRTVDDALEGEAGTLLEALPATNGNGQEPAATNGRLDEPEEGSPVVEEEAVEARSGRA